MPIFEEERLSERLRLGFVFDGGQLFGQMTIAENVALPLRYHQNLSRADAESRVREIMELLELAPFARNAPASVARNWQKRAGLARALILQPDVLLLDNPLGGLDARHASWWLNFLEQLSAGHSFIAGRPVTVAITTDDLSRFAGTRARAARFAMLHDKKFQVVGSREELTASADPLVKELLAGAASGN
jgi:ABC-type transporter Mla maintaining outer membrane lipid asymmetry ATPase subunit MlaF